MVLTRPGQPLGEAIRAGGVWLRLAGNPPRVDAEEDDVAPLALLLDAALDGAPPDLEALLERGDDIVTAAASARRPGPDADLARAAARWRERGGAVDDDAYLVSSPAAPAPLLVPRAALREAWAALRAHAVRVPDLAAADELKAAARALDATPAPTAAARERLEARLAAAGVLDGAAGTAVRQRLAEAGHTTLVSWADAAAARRSYLASAERLTLADDVRARRGPSGATLDWFRHPQPDPPGGVGAAAWLARLELALDRAAPEGSEGRLTIAADGDWELAWRRQDGVPALVAVRPAP